MLSRIELHQASTPASPGPSWSIFAEVKRTEVQTSDLAVAVVVEPRTERELNDPVAVTCALIMTNDGRLYIN